MLVSVRLLVRILALCLLQRPVFAEEAEVLRFIQGEQRRFYVRNVKRFRLGRAILKSKPNLNANESSIFFKAVQPGVTDLWLEFKDGKKRRHIIEVFTARSQKPVPVRLVQLLNELEETEITWVNDVFLATGLIASESELWRLDRLQQKFASLLRFDIRVTDALFARMQLVIQNALRQVSGIEAEFHKIGTPWRFQGVALSKLFAAKAQSHLRSLVPLLEWAVEVFPDDHPVMHFRVFILEVERKGFQRIGVDWSRDIKNGLTTWPLHLQPISTLLSRIEAWETDGIIRVLSKPELVVRVPGEAEFFSGGELPIPIRRKRHTSIQWRKFGLRLKLKVQARVGDRIRLQIRTEQSELGAQVGQESLPSIQASQMETEVDARLRMPILLAGLIQKRQSSTKSGVTGVSKIPIFGSLLGVSDQIKNERELMAFIYPTLFSDLNDWKMLRPGLRTPTKPFPGRKIPLEEESRLRLDPAFPWNVLE